MPPSVPTYGSPSRSKKTSPGDGAGRLAYPRSRVGARMLTDGSARVARESTCSAAWWCSRSKRSAPSAPGRCRRGLREPEDGGALLARQALALVAPGAGDEAEVVVGDAAGVALIGKCADRAVLDGLGIGLDGLTVDDLLERRATWRCSAA